MKKRNVDLLAYTLQELEIAQDRSDPRNVMPAIPPSCQSVLDLGCGAGQTLMTSDLPPGALSVGVERNAEAVRIGRQLFPDLNIVCASAESLPFPDGSFQFVFSRVAIPYTNIPAALKEIRRTLADGGELWLSLHPPRMIAAHLFTAIRSLNPKGILYQLYVCANGLYFHFSGNMLRWPLGGGRYESFQTPGAIRRALQSAGFTTLTVDLDKHFVVTARKPSRSGQPRPQSARLSSEELAQQTRA